MSVGPSENQVEQAVTWYSAHRSLYDALATKVAEILREVLEDEEIEYHDIPSRAKEIESFRRKAAQERYTDPTTEITDLAGVRVITYVESEARKVAELVERLFDIDREQSIDKSNELGVNRVGYRSIHYVASLPAERLALPECKKFSELKFEIQVRTILQHTWAEIEHDRNYKFRGVLPPEIQRRFAILSGTLELADREFDTIARDIDSYSEKVAAETEAGRLEIPINTTSLRQYMSSRFKDAIEAGLEPTFGPGDDQATAIVQELADFGIANLSELDAAIPEDLHEHAPWGYPGSNFVGLLRLIMVISDTERYFKDAWNSGWTFVDHVMVQVLEAYGIDVSRLVKMYDLIRLPELVRHS